MARKNEPRLTVTARHGWFSRGQEHLPRRMRQSSFADGQALSHDHEHHGRFSDGQEHSNSTAANELEGTFDLGHPGTP
jgi:hypothetical protein